MYVIAAATIPLYLAQYSYGISLKSPLIRALDGQTLHPRHGTRLLMDTASAPASTTPSAATSSTPLPARPRPGTRLQHSWQGHRQERNFPTACPEQDFSIIQHRTGHHLKAKYPPRHKGHKKAGCQSFDFQPAVVHKRGINPRRFRLLRTQRGAWSEHHLEQADSQRSSLRM